jgi:hypothetical protein
MATGHNKFFVVEELSSRAFCKVAAPVSPKRGYPELPDLSDNPLPSYIIPNYEKIKVPHTSLASNITQHKVQTLRIKDEIRFVYRKKEQLNTQPL